MNLRIRVLGLLPDPWHHQAPGSLPRSADQEQHSSLAAGDTFGSTGPSLGVDGVQETGRLSGADGAVTTDTPSGED